MREQLARLGGHVAETRDRVLAQRNHLRVVRNRLLARPRQQRARQRQRLILALAAAGAGAAVAAALTLIWIAPRQGNYAAPPLTFTVINPSRPQTDRRPGVVGRWLEASGDSASTGDRRTLRIRFSDGSTVDLEPRARARVTKLDHRGARLRLRRGTAKVHVVPRRTNRWWLDVGPFQVRVVGTRFAASWDPAARVFGLALDRGKVLVRGPGLAQRAVGAGQRLRVWLDDGRVQLSDASATARATPIAEPPPPDEGTVPPGPVDDEAADEILRAQVAGSDEPPPTGRASEADPEPVDPAEADELLRAQVAPPSSPSNLGDKPWDLARAGRYTEALQVAGRIGWDSLLERSSASQLIVLGDAARLMKRTARATAIYRRVRERFARSVAAAEAAFSLGQIAFDRHRDHALAAAWFARYLAEQPSGRLAREALGRLLEARLLSGNARAARRVAGRYLQRFPAGPHAGLARRHAVKNAPAAGSNARPRRGR